jgi:hypothetical protein
LVLKKHDIPNAKQVVYLNVIDFVYCVLAWGSLAQRSEKQLTPTEKVHPFQIFIDVHRF